MAREAAAAAAAPAARQDQSGTEEDGTEGGVESDKSGLGRGHLRRRQRAVTSELHVDDTEEELDKGEGEQEIFHDALDSPQQPQSNEDHSKRRPKQRRPPQRQHRLSRHSRTGSKAGSSDGRRAEGGLSDDNALGEVVAELGELRTVLGQVAERLESLALLSPTHPLSAPAGTGGSGAGGGMMLRTRSRSLNSLLSLDGASRHSGGSGGSGRGGGESGEGAANIATNNTTSGSNIILGTETFSGGCGGCYMLILGLGLGLGLGWRSGRSPFWGS